MLGSLSPPSATTLLRWWHTPKIRRGVLLSILGVGGLRRRARAGRLGPRLRRQPLPLHRGARHLRPRPGLEGLRRRRPPDHRPRHGAPHRRAAGGDVALPSSPPSWPPRTSASTSTTASTGSGSSARSRPTSWPVGVSEGFSTITMQLAGNLFPEDINRQERSLGRKLREARVAREIEAQVLQGQDPRALPQPDRPGQPGVRGGGRLAALLRQVGARPQRGRGRHAGRACPRRPAGTTRGGIPARALQRRNLILGLLARQRHHHAGRRRSAGGPIRCCSPRATTSAASPTTSSSTSASSSTRGSARGSTPTASGSTPRSISTSSRPRSGRSSPQLERHRGRHATGPTRTRPTRPYLEQKAESDDETRAHHDALPAGRSR